MKNNGRVILVSSIRDAVELMNHNTEVFIRSVNKLGKSNRNLKALCMVAVGCAVYTAIENRKLEERVYQLEVRTKKLERNEEEGE